MKTFRQHLYTTISILMVIPMMIMLVIVMPLSMVGITQNTGKRLEVIADQKTVQLENWLRQGQEVVTLAATDEYCHCLGELSNHNMYLVTDEKLPAIEKLKSIVAIFPSVSSVSIIEPNQGVVVFSSEVSLIGRVRLHELYFINGKIKEYTSPVTYSVGQERPVLYISKPVYDAKTDELLAVVAVEMNLDDLDDIFSDMGSDRDERAYLVDEYGFYVTVPNKWPGSPLSTVAQSDAVERVTSGFAETRIYRDPQHNYVLGSYRWLSWLQVGIIVEIDFFALVQEIFKVGIVPLLLTLALPIVSLLIISRTVNALVDPIEELSRSMSQLREGNMNTRAKVGGPEEISRVAGIFNSMAQELQHHYRNLETQVTMRTMELENSNKHLTAEIEKSTQLQQKLEQLVITDQLTGIYNRRHFFNEASHEFERARRYKHPIALIMFDIDHFKNVNDRYGHSIGDVALRTVALIARDQMRDNDVVARYGGEEFIILLPETDCDQAYILAERLRKAVEDIDIPTPSDVIKLTISLGITCLEPKTTNSLDALIEKVDNALYTAKHTGRNKSITIK